MIQPTVGFIVYGVHKDGLQDPMGVPFINDKIVAQSKAALRQAGLKLVEHDVVIASKAEARAALKAMKNNDAVDCVVLFSGTWVWSAHLIAAIRDFAASGKAILIWTHPGSQGWRPVGGLVLHGALLEVGIPHKFVYGPADDPAEIERIVSYCQAAHLKQALNMATIGAFGGRGMGQTCGAADPSQWMRVFGVDIDSRDTTELIRAAQAVTQDEIQALLPRLGQLFEKQPELNEVNERSIRLYLALKKTVAKEGFDFYTIQSFPGLGDDFCGSCFAQSMMLEYGLRRLDPGRLQHGDDRLAAHKTKQGARLLRRPATHRQAEKRDQDHRRRGLPALAGEQTGAGGFRRARHPDRGRGRRPVRQAGLQSRRGGPGAPGPQQRPVRDGHHPLHDFRAAGGPARCPQKRMRHPLLAARIRHRPLRHGHNARALEQRVRLPGVTARTFCRP